MAKEQPEVVGKVVAFKLKPRSMIYLTPLDRTEVRRWRETACAAGYDRMIIHQREAGDDVEFGDFLCLHRRGEPWSRWGFARKDKQVNVWCCLTGADVGGFTSLSAAFEAVMPGSSVELQHTQSYSGVVTDLMPRLRESARRLGSAA